MQNQCTETFRYLPDFILAFAFFTSVARAVHGKRLEQQWRTLTMPAEVGSAPSHGLVWREQANGLPRMHVGGRTAYLTDSARQWLPQNVTRSH